MEFSGNHILSKDQFDRSDIEKLFAVADKLEPFASKEKITRVRCFETLSNLYQTAILQSHMRNQTKKLNL